jgi:hypothetical protein
VGRGEVGAGGPWCAGGGVAGSRTATGCQASAGGRAVIFGGNEGTLRLGYSVDARAWELSRGPARVGLFVLERGRIEGDGRSWTVAVLRRPRCLVFEPLAAGEPTAAFYPPRWRSEGTLAFGEDHWYRLRWARGACLLVDQDDTEFLRFRKDGSGGRKQPPIYRVILRISAPEPAATTHFVTLAATFVFLSYWPWQPRAPANQWALSVSG